MIRGFSRRCIFALAAGGSAALCIALLIRLTVRDRFTVFAGLFYATPWPVLAAVAAVLAVFWRHQRRRSLSRALAGFAVLALAAWVASSWRLHPRPAARGDLRVVLWNVSRPTGGLPAMARWLRAQDADIIALAEGYRDGESSLARWQHELPGYAAVELRGEMTCLVRGKIIPEEVHPGRTDLNYALLHVEVRGHPLTLLQIDINPSFAKSRRRALGELTTLARSNLAGSFIVLGDFNTPRESALLDSFRGEMTHAFEAAGRGFAETWPMPLPVLSLDQIWTSRGLRAVHCGQGHSLRSDHRAVVADFVFAQPR